MRAARIAVAGVVALAVTGCAPQSMAPNDLPAETVAVEMTTAAVDGAEDSAAHAGLASEEAASSAGVAMDGAPGVEQQQTAETRELAWQRNTQADSGWTNLYVDNVAYSEVERLEPVSPTFREYVAEAMSSADTDGCTVLELSIIGTHPAGFILGTLSTDCGGGQAIWASHPTTDEWSLVKLLQAAPECSELEELAMPRGLGLLCLNADGGAAEY